MIKRSYSVISPVTLGLLLGLGLSGVQLNAQQSDTQQTPPPSQQQTPPEAQSPSQQQAPPDAQSPSQQQASPDAHSPTQQQSQEQTFAGTIMKLGDKYVLQDANGTTYNVDRQDLVKSHEGKKVRINGTLDPDGKTIHVK